MSQDGGTCTDIRGDLDTHKSSNFQSLQVVDRGSETQLQVTENLNVLVHKHYSRSSLSGVLLAFQVFNK